MSRFLEKRNKIRNAEFRIPNSYPPLQIYRPQKEKTPSGVFFIRLIRNIDQNILDLTAESFTDF